VHLQHLIKLFTPHTPYFYASHPQIHELVRTIFENNRQWVASKQAQDAHFLKNSLSDQTPDYLYIGCSDSRDTSNEIMGLRLGTFLYTATLPTLSSIPPQCHEVLSIMLLPNWK